MKRVVFSSGQGSGYLSRSKDIEGRFERRGVDFVFGRIVCDELTDLGGFFMNKVEYKGRDGDELLFYLGSHSGVHYYQSVYFIADNRIYIQYAYESGRDFRYVEGEWK